MELADMQDLGSCAGRRGCSSHLIRTSKTAQYRYWPEKARSYAGFFVGKELLNQNGLLRQYGEAAFDITQ